MEKKFVEYNGIMVIEGWPEQIEEAQLQATYLIGGVEYQRVRYGNEKDDCICQGSFARPCRNCAVIKGQYHVMGCSIERCPACGGQASSCSCVESARDSMLLNEIGKTVKRCNGQ